MTRKHFEALAAAIHHAHVRTMNTKDPNAVAAVYADHIAVVCKASNPDFNTDSFLKAAGVK